MTKHTRHELTKSASFVLTYSRTDPVYVPNQSIGLNHSNVNFNLIRNVSICSLHLKPSWSLNFMGSSSFLRSNNSIPHKKPPRVKISWKFTRCAGRSERAQTLSAEEDGKHGKGQFSQWYATLPLLPPPQPLAALFLIENFLRNIFRFTLRLNLEVALHARMTAA